MKLKESIIRKKYFWIGTIMGITQQLMGTLDYFLYRGRDFFSFSKIMGGLSLYAGIILLTINKKKSPKQQSGDIFMFFLGLDFFYYLYIFIKDIIAYMIAKAKYPEHLHEIGYYFQSTYVEIFDFIKWTTIAAAASIWVYLSVKFRENGWKKRYTAMLIPLISVIILELFSYSYSIYQYIIQEYRIAHNLYVPEGFSYGCTISEFLTSAVMLIICIKKICIKRQTTQ